MLISIIVAMSQNRVIGKDGGMPWHLPADLQRFKRITMGQSLLMGRKTFESIGRPLPGRETIILSRDPDFRVSGCQVVCDLQAGVAAAQTDELFICGGEQLYREALPLVQRIYLTELLREVKGDTFFPELPEGEFHLMKQETLPGEDPCLFSVWERGLSSNGIC